MFKKLLFAVLLALMGAGASADVNFSLSNTASDTGSGGYFGSATWASTAYAGGYFGGFDLVGADRSWFTRGAVGVTGIEDITRFTATFSQASKVTFSWSYVTADSNLLADSAGYVVNGVSYDLTSSGARSGVVTVIVGALQSFGWYVKSNDELGGGATVTISNVVIDAVPEPASLPMLLAGLGVIGWGVVRRRRV